MLLSCFLFFKLAVLTAWSNCIMCSPFQILTPFLLRRLKSDVALEVPPKREVVVYAPLAKKQETFYTAIVNRTIRKLLGNNEVSTDKDVRNVLAFNSRYVKPRWYCFITVVTKPAFLLEFLVDLFVIYFSASYCDRPVVQN